MMDECYFGFATVYDEFMDNVDYEGWTDFIVGLLGKYGITEGLGLDLGCGTGTMTEALSAAGFDMIGVDVSSDMLTEALAKREESGADILYLCQDMTAFELYGTVRFIVSVCDCLNYVLEEEDLAKVFSLVENYLDPGGLFIFDMHTRHYYQSAIGDGVIAENREDASFIWENSFYPSLDINEFLLTLFLQQENGLFERSQEIHTQKAYSLGTVVKLLQAAGLTILEIHDGYSQREGGEDSDRVVFVVQKMRR